MGTSEALTPIYPHPENLSRPEAMRHETGPVVTLFTDRVLQTLRTSLAERPILRDPNNCSTTEKLARISDLLEASADGHIEQWSHEFIEQTDIDRVLFYSYYHRILAPYRRIQTQIADGIAPQLMLTTNLIIPGFVEAAYDGTSVNELTLSDIAKLLQREDFEKVLVSLTKTANGLFKDGYNQKYSVDLDSVTPEEKRFHDTVKQLEELSKTPRPSQDTAPQGYALSPKNLCVKEKDGVRLSDEARKYITAFLKYKNEAGHTKEQHIATLPDETQYVSDYSTRSSGCPVSIRSGDFPFHLLSAEVLVSSYGAEAQSDGSIIVPNVMTISPEGRYTYHNPAPVILSLNRLFAEQILAADATLIK